MKPTENFRKTLEQLKAYTATPIEDDRDRSGVIQAFEFTFEQSWKAIQKIAGKQGVDVASPKGAFSFAMQSKWIVAKQEQDWLQMIGDRNLTSHTYREDIANEVLERITGKYIAMFESLLAALSSHR